MDHKAGNQLPHGWMMGFSTVQVEKIPPKGVSFSDLICIFAISYQSFAYFLFATLR